MIREAYVAGTFYPRDPVSLKKEVDKFLSAGNREPKSASAIIAPHAGYVYSGSTAGMTYASVDIPDRVVVICPNHTGMGEEVAVMNRGSWQIPGGEAKVAEELSDLFLSRCSLAAADTGAHLREHSLEVQLPFILRKNPRARILPLALMGMGDYESVSRIASALVEAVKEYGKETFFVASSDMSHFISEKEARYYDMMALDKIKKLDAAGLLQKVKDEDISMCGAFPCAVVVETAKILGAKKGEIISYSTSARVTGERLNVVGYAGVRISH